MHAVASTKRRSLTFTRPQTPHSQRSFGTGEAGVDVGFRGSRLRIIPANAGHLLLESNSLGS